MGVINEMVEDATESLYEGSQNNTDQDVDKCINEFE
jgi:hypothetical protein